MTALLPALLLCQFATPALAHGGEDHASAAPTAALSSSAGLASSKSADTVSVSASSATFDAVVRVPRPAASPVPGSPAASPAVATTLLLADADTSAPVEGATASLTLSGPSQVKAEFAATASPGVYVARPTFSAFGDYAGALVVTAGAASDLLSVTGLDVDPAEPPPGASPLSYGWIALGAVVVAVGAGTVGLVGGLLIGRRSAVRGAGVGLLGLGLAGGVTGRVEAHGGVDDEGPAPGAVQAAGGPLVLPMESQFLLGLRTQRVVRDRFAESTAAAGHFVARPGESATLRAPVGGVLVAPAGGFPAPGSEVRSGDVLATIVESVGGADRATVAQERAAAGVELAEARRVLALAERDAGQLDRIAEGLSGRERLDREESVIVARERLKQAERAVGALGGEVVIRAPVSGRLGAVTARPGDQVEAGAALFRVLDPAGLWMEARVPERQALGVTAGASASVLAAADPGHPLRAVVLDAGQEADPSTGTVLVTLAVEGDSGGLRVGMGATAWIDRGPVRDALVLPDEAVVDSNGATLVFVKTGPERFEAHELRLGARSGDTWEVLAGLAPQDRVVTVGTYALRSLAGR